MSIAKQLRHLLLILRAVAWNTFRVAVRNKVFLALFVVAIGLMAFGLVLGAMSLHHEVRVATNISLFATTVFGAAMAIYMSVSLFYAELEKRTIYTLLSKPVRRWQFLLGKYLGTVFTLILIVGLLALAGIGLVAIQGGQPSGAFGIAYLLIGCQLAVVSAIATLFVSFSRPLLSGLFATGVFILGHLHDQIGGVADMLDSAVVDALIGFLQTVIPDLAALNISTAVVHDLPVPMDYATAGVRYAVLYSALTLSAAMFLFHQRDLE